MPEPLFCLWALEEWEAEGRRRSPRGWNPGLLFAAGLPLWDSPGGRYSLDVSLTSHSSGQSQPTEFHNPTQANLEGKLGWPRPQPAGSPPTRPPQPCTSFSTTLSSSSGPVWHPALPPSRRRHKSPLFCGSDLIVCVVLALLQACPREMEGKKLAQA